MRIDDRQVLRTNFAEAQTPTAGPWASDREFAVPIPAGKRNIEIANDGGGNSILLDSVKLEQVQPAEFEGGWRFGPEAVGLRGPKAAVVYVCSPVVVYPAGASIFNPPLMSGQPVKVAAWPAGHFVAEWFDPCTGKTVGKTEASTEDATLALPVPAFREDLAGVITQQ